MLWTRTDLAIRDADEAIAEALRELPDFLAAMKRSGWFSEDLPGAPQRDQLVSGSPRNQADDPKIVPATKITGARRARRVP